MIYNVTFWSFIFLQLLECFWGFRVKSLCMLVRSLMGSQEASQKLVPRGGSHLIKGSRLSDPPTTSRKGEKLELELTVIGQWYNHCIETSKMSKRTGFTELPESWPHEVSWSLIPDRGHRNLPTSLYPLKCVGNKPVHVNETILWDLELL